MPKTEDNDGGASPQNTQPERTQEPEVEPTTEQNIIEDNNAEIADEQQHNAELRENAALARHLPNDSNSDAQMTAEQQRRKVRAEINDSGDDMETPSTRAPTPENLLRREKATKENPGLLNRLSGLGGQLFC